MCIPSPSSCAIVCPYTLKDPHETTLARIKGEYGLEAQAVPEVLSISLVKVDAADCDGIGLTRKLQKFPSVVSDWYKIARSAIW